MQKLRRKASEQEERQNKYSMEAEQLMAGNSWTGSKTTVKCVMKAWLRVTKKQS